MASLAGRFLVAANILRDPNFLRAVVLLVRHDDDGAFGLVLNRPMDAQLDQIWAQLSETPCERTDPLYIGGPVEGPFTALHTNETLSDLEVSAGLYFSGEKSNLEQLMAGDQAPARFFVGFAGWGPGQLEAELNEQAWLTSSATIEMIFSDATDLWERVNRGIAHEGVISALHIKHVPPNPSLN
ncbi:MAG: YqgE/AlgH family protein [Pirellulales bacterium]